jgi:hypothetical protein
VSALQASGPADLPPRGEVSEIVALWGCTLPVALLGSWTCFGELPGVNWALWTAAAAAGFLLIGRRFGRSSANRHPRAALGLACLLSIAAALTANPHADALIFLSVAGLFAYCVLATAASSSEIGPAALLRAPLAIGRLLLAEAAARIAETFAVVRMRRAVPLVRGSAMALGLAATLFLLLSAADPTLADWRQLAWDTILSRTFVARDVFFIALSVLLLGAYGLASRRSKAPSSRPGAGNHPAAPAALFSGLERLMVLGAALLLFFAFFAVELSHQLASSGVHLMAGETFAEATHRGFGEMIVAATLCALVIITLEQHALRSAGERRVRLLSWGVIAASLVIVASAYQRVRYYEAAYGYTEERLYVQAICGLVSLALLSLASELRSTINVPRLIRHVALIAVACVAGLSYWNSAAWIVVANVARYEGTGKLDVNYLERLARTSPDAIPALIAAVPSLAPADASRLRESLQHTAIDRSILLPRSATGGLSWYELSVRRAEARAALRSAGLLAGAAARGSGLARESPRILVRAQQSLHHGLEVGGG